MRTFPFTAFLAVEMDVSCVAIERAVSVWLQAHWTYPTVLWVHPMDLGIAERALCLAPEGSIVRRLTPIPDPHYEEGWWSVGSHLVKGFGCGGA